MNYLAHLVLSGDDADLMLGNFIGDAVKGSPESQYPDAIARGIRLHRWIDSTADGHMLAQEARAALRPALGRFSGVGVDLLYDHFLARNFEKATHGMALDAFATEVHAELKTRQEDMPLRSQRFFQAMVEHDWLVGYASRAGMLAVCRAMDSRLEARLQTPSPLHRLFEAADVAGTPRLESDFLEFWEEISTKRDALEWAHAAGETLA
jgi:acyl carrier protein phosphodiesterase